MTELSVSIGICAYNEDKNIGNLLDSLLNQRTEVVKIEEIIVVSSGSTDRTDEIVQGFSKTDGRLRLVVQQERRGKIPAVNEFLKVAKGAILVLINADLLPVEDTIEKLCIPFLDPAVGVAGGRPVPVTPPNTLCGFINHLIWNLHHEISLKNPENPKIGEMYAFRNAIESLPESVLNDEEATRVAVLKQGYSVAYSPDAIIFNRGPETLRELIKQRKRWNIADRHLMETANFDNPTWKHFEILKILARRLPRDIRKSILSPIYLLIAVLMEAYVRAYSVYYVRRRLRDPSKFDAIFKWDIIESTKKVERGQDK